MWNQVSYDPRSYERNLRNFNWANEATDFGSCLFVGSNEPVRNESEIIYEIFHA